MRITEAEREVLRKNVKNMIPQFKKSEIVNHFKKEGYKERTIYNTIEHMRTGRPPVLDTHQRKRLKRLVNNRTGVSQRRLGQKFQVNQTTIGRALEKMHISCYKREKTPRSTEKQAKKSQELCRKLANLFYRDSCSIRFFIG